MIKRNYSEKPSAVLIETVNGSHHITVNINAQREELEGGLVNWTADANEFWEKVENIDLVDVKANPEKYSTYLPLNIRESGKKDAQIILDDHRAGAHCMPVIPVPFVKEGALICNRPSDQVKLTAILTIGQGIEYYELYDGSIVSLTAEQVQQVFLAGMQVETEMQKAKQACWSKIDAAGSKEEIDQALAEFKTALHPYGV